MRGQERTILPSRRTLAASLPELADGLAPLQRALSGSVQRPCCHFELPASTYLAQGPTCACESEGA